MGAEDILNLLREQPFQPFRIIMVSGKRYEVHHPELLNAGYYTTIYFKKEDLDKPSKGFELLATALIERIEFIESAQPAAA